VYTNSIGVQSTSVLQECWSRVEVYSISTVVQWVQEYYKGTGVPQEYRKFTGVHVYMGTGTAQFCRDAGVLQ
jgi:hypothetical protein